MIARNEHLDTLIGLLRDFPVVGLIGARQVGKTTMARELASRWDGDISFYDLEDPASRARLSDPMLALGGAQGLVVIDEVQRSPDLFPILRVLADRPGTAVRFLVLGSASPVLLRQSSESLAGRIAYHELPGFSLGEIGIDHADRLWLRGGFPRSFLARTERASMEWRRQFIRTFLERDIPQLGIRIPAETLRRFWSMLAHWHGQVLNYSELGRSLGVSDTRVRGYLDVFTSTYLVRRLLPWHVNLKKRQVKMPKVFLTDPGLLHALLGQETQEELEGHPKVGASFEGFVLDQVVARVGARPEECFFWATHGGAELDLLIARGNRLVGFEVKRTTAPRRTRSMATALSDLNLEHIYVLHAGTERYPLSQEITAVPLTQLLTSFPEYP